VVDVQNDFYPNLEPAPLRVAMKRFPAIAAEGAYFVASVCPLRIYHLTTYCIYARGIAALLVKGVFSRHPECGARCGVLRRRLATAAPGGRDPARQALRPGREELAVTDPDPLRLRLRRVTRGGKRGTRRAQNRHGGAPGGVRPASWDARRLARRLACRVTCTPTGVPPSTRTSLGAPPTPHRG
jgi:hypothetical protein